MEVQWPVRDALHTLAQDRLNRRPGTDWAPVLG